MEARVHDHDLTEDHGGQCIEIDPMDVSVEDQIACCPEKNQEIQLCIKEAGQGETKREASEGRGGERTGGDQEQTPMDFRFFRQ